MRIGLIDADLMWRKRANGRRYGNQKADIFPNLALMKISAHYKQNGHEVEWYNPRSFSTISGALASEFSDAVSDISERISP